MAKELGSIATTSGNKSKNKPTKKRRDALKKKLAKNQVVNNDPVFGDVNVDKDEDNQQTEICKKFILVDDPMVFIPLGIQQNTPPIGDPSDDMTNICTLNSDPTLPSASEKDEYVVIHSEDKFDDDNLPLNDEDEYDTLSEHLIRVFSPSHNANLQDKIQQVAQEQGLSPRGMNLIRGQGKRQTPNDLSLFAGPIQGSLHLSHPND